MSGLFYCWPQRWAAAVGFHKPTVGGLTPPTSPSRQASSPRLGQGGRGKTLMQGIWPQGVHSPHNRVSPSSARFARWSREPDHPRRRRCRPFRVATGALGAAPLGGRGGLARAFGTYSTPRSARVVGLRRRRGRSAFLLEPPSERPRGGRLRRLLILNDQCIAGRPKRPSWALSGARRCH
jgi:hypothetical protein